MHLDPDSVLQLAELERACASRKPEMPVVATGVAGQLALTSDDKTTLAAFGKRLGSRQLQVEFEHARL